MKKSLAILLALIMTLMLVPTAAFAEGEVAQIDDTKYATLDAAIEAAQDGETIELLANCTTAGMNLSKNLTIDGGGGEATKYTVTFSDKGIALGGKSLTFKNCNLVMNGIGSTYDVSWTAICASKEASLTLENTEMTMTGAEGNTAHAIYFCSNNKLNLTNSKLEIKNYQQDALEWDGGDGGYNVNITNSTFISDHNRSGFTGTFTAKIDNSKVEVINSTGNGSNGSHFEIVNGSVVKFNNNGSHGLSAGNLTIDKSTVEAIGNDANGVHVAGKLEIKDNSNVTIQGNKCTISSQYTIPGALYIVGESKITESTVTITKNEGSGIYQKSGSLTVDPSAKLTIKNNKAVKLGYGGGVNVNGTMNLPANVELYNNHADAAGDDIYSTNTITFGAVGSNWILDDCNHKIDGWYEDGMPEKEDATGKRWCGTYDGKVCVAGREAYMESMEAGEYKTAIALKAAHCAQTTPPTPTPYSGSSSSGNTYSWYFNPTPSPAPVVVPAAVVLPKTGDMTIWQSILQFLGIR